MMNFKGHHVILAAIEVWIEENPAVRWGIICGLLFGSIQVGSWLILKA